MVLMLKLFFLHILILSTSHFISPIYWRISREFELDLKLETNWFSFFITQEIYQRCVFCLFWRLAWKNLFCLRKTDRSWTGKSTLFYWELLSILYTPTPQNGQTHWNNLLAVAEELFECVWAFCEVSA